MNGSASGVKSRHGKQKALKGLELSRKQIALLLLITIGAVLIHGYHPTAEDGELYLPGIKKDLNPALYPFNHRLFMSHARMTLFDELVAASVRVSHLPFDYAVFLWHFACIFLFLLGCWRVGRLCFNDERAPWGGVALVAALLTIPVAGTALYIMDQYLSPRDLSTAGIMLVLAEALQGRFWPVAIGILLIASLHPLMAAFAIALLFLLYLEERRPEATAAKPVTAKAMLLVPLLPFLQPVSGIYRRLLDTNASYFLVVHWPWYEWVGIFAPLLLLWWTARYGKKQGLPKVEALSRSLLVFGVVCFAAALLLCIPRLAGLALLQPMRCLHLIFIVLFVLLGRRAGEVGVAVAGVAMGGIRGAPVPCDAPGAAPTVSRNRTFGVTGKSAQKCLGAGVCLGPYPHAR